MRAFCRFRAQLSQFIANGEQRARGESHEHRHSEEAERPQPRVHLVKLAADQHVLVSTAHHIICDGWSINVFVNELAEVYPIFCRGETAQLAPALAYSEYVRGQSKPEPDEGYLLARLAPTALGTLSRKGRKGRGTPALTSYASSIAACTQLLMMSSRRECQGSGMRLLVR